MALRDESFSAPVQVEPGRLSLLGVSGKDEQGAHLGLSVVVFAETVEASYGTGEAPTAGGRGREQDIYRRKALWIGCH